MIQLKLPDEDFIIDSGPPTGSQRPPPHKKRRILITLLAVQLLLLFLIFPLLIAYFESEYIQPEVEQGDEPELISNNLQPYHHYIDGLYWSLVTPISVSSTAAWPKSPQSWFIVRVSDVTKLLTIGVSARLLHDRIAHHKIQVRPHPNYFRHRRSRESEPDQAAPLPQIHLLEEWSGPPENRSPQSITAIIMVILFKRNRGRKDDDNPDGEDPPPQFS